MTSLVSTIYKPRAHLLAFVDALGFSHEISNPKSDKIDTYLKTFDLLTKGWRGRGAKKNLKLSTIGDSIILGIEIPGANTGGTMMPESQFDFFEALYNLSFAIAELQYGLAINNIWTRGAITYGLVDFDPKIGRLLGPAFHRAYYLEQKIARFPRVILDGGIVKAGSASTAHELVAKINNRGDTKTLFDFHDVPVLFDIPHDVPAFVDFGSWTAVRMGRSALDALAVNLSARFKGDAEHFHKYSWMAEYLLLSIRTSLYENELSTAIQLLQEK